MKKGTRATLLIVCAAFLLAACGKKTGAVTTSEEIVVPEMSSEDLLVTSLEYLLEEEDEDGETEAKEAGQEKSDEADAGGADRQEEEPELVTATIVYYGAAGLKEESISVEEITPEALIGALARHNIVPLLDTKVLSLEEQEEDGMKVLYLDLSNAFREYLLTMSEEAECDIMASVACTFLANYDAGAMYITVKGEPLVTSHAEYTEAIYDFTPGEMHRFMTPAEGEADEESAAEP